MSGDASAGRGGSGEVVVASGEHLREGKFERRQVLGFNLRLCSDRAYHFCWEHFFV